MPKLRDLLKPKKPPSQLPSQSTATDLVQSGPSTSSSDELFRQAQSMHQSGEIEKAIELYALCLERTPDQAEAFYKRGNALNSLGRLDRALEDYNRAIDLDPSYAYALCNRGSVLERLGRKEEALASYDRALGVDPTDSMTHYNRGSVLKDLKRYTEALTSYESAIALNGKYAEAYVNRGNVLRELRRWDAAIDSFERAIALDPTIAHAFQGRGICFHTLRRFEPALADYNEAIALKPGLGTAYLHRGNLFAELDRHLEAVADYRKATELEPDPAAFQSLATSLLRLNRLDEAIASLDKAAAIDPHLNYLLGTTMATKMQACVWDGFEEAIEQIVKGVRERRLVCNPMTLAYLIDSAALLRSATEVWVEDQIEGTCDEDRSRIAATLPKLTYPLTSAKIRIGYFSGDFRTHPVAYLTAGLFEHHDRANFEITAFAFGPESRDAIRSRLVKGFDRFIDVRHKSDLEVTRLARDLGIDIAVDLSGHTAHCRSRIFALRAAPVQVNFLGYPGTMGANFMDYLIADGTVVPRAQQVHYCEKIAYLPGSFLPFDSGYTIADRTFTRAELGLPSGGVVFCCFNNNYKILPEVFDRWMRILSLTEHSVLWLHQVDGAVAANLRQQASQRGVDARRLVFAQRMQSVHEHLARIRAADLFLDTFPYNAHATALDALWAGVPLLTLPGESFASRVASSLLNAVGLHELVADSPSRYEQTALELAVDAARLGQLRNKLALRDAPIFDTERYTKNLEAIYRTMYERQKAGLPPAHLSEHLAS